MNLALPVFFAFLCVLCGCLFLIFRERRHRPLSFARYFADFKPTLASHRGYGKYAEIPENTIPAFKASEKLGFTAHELDVRRTRDRQIVLLHGPRLENTTDGQGRIEEHSYPHVQTLNAAHYVARLFDGTKVARTPMPTLTDVLLQTGKNTRINIEIKRDRWDFSRGLEEETVHAVREAKAETRVFFSGFHFLTLWRLRRLNSGIPVGLLIEPGPMARFKFWLYRLILLPDNIHLHFTTPTPALMRRLKRQGYGLAFWTVNNEDVARGLFDLGADVVITDKMEFIRQFPDEKIRAAGRRS